MIIKFISMMLLGIFSGTIAIKLIQFFSEEKAQPISVVVLSTLLVVLGYYKYGITLIGLYHLVFWMGLLVVGWVDYLTLSIVDFTVYALGLWAFLFRLFLIGNSVEGLIGGLVGFGLFLGIYLGAKWVYKKEAFGFGDVLLMGSVGIYLGFKLTLLASFLSFYVALVGIGIQKTLGKKIGLKQEVAFGPAICMAVILSVMYGETWLNWYVKTFLF